MKTTVMAVPYREAVANMREVIGAAHPIGTIDFELLSEALERITGLITAGVMPIEHVDVDTVGGTRALEALTQYARTKQSA